MPQAYYEATRGPPDAWQALEKIPKEEWAEYLAWFRKVLRIPAQNGRRVALLEPLPAQVSCMHACVHARGRGVCASMCVRGPPSSAQDARPPCNCTVPQDGRGYVYRMSLEVTAPGASAPTSATLYARKVVLATGIQGGGEWHVCRQTDSDRVTTAAPDFKLKDSRYHDRDRQ